VSAGAEDPFQRVRARSLFALVALCGILTLLPFRRVAATIGPTWATPLTDLAFFLAILLVPAYLCRRTGVDLGRLVGPRPPAAALLGSAGLAVPLVALSLGTLWALYLPLSYLAPDFVQYWLLDDWSMLEHTDLGYPLGPNALVLAAGCVLAPLAEEFLFRGLLIHRWSLRWGVRAAVGLSSLVFGLLHADVLGGIAFGVVAAVLYLESGSLHHAIALHVANNVLAFGAVLVEIALTGQENRLDMEGFRSLAWVGVLGLALGVPWFVHFLRTRWRPEQWRLPHGATATPGS
jgi:membrane protease YdiL (CAAX protease family)